MPSERASPPTASRARSMVSAPQQILRAEPSEDQVRVGDRRRRAPTVAGGPRIGPRASGSDAQRAGTVAPRDRFPARAHRAHLDHRRAERKPRDRAECHPRALLDEHRVGRSAAHVEGEDAAIPETTRERLRGSAPPARGRREPCGRASAAAARGVAVVPSDCRMVDGCRGRHGQRLGDRAPRSGAERHWRRSSRSARTRGTRPRSRATGVTGTPSEASARPTRRSFPGSRYA